MGLYDDFEDDWYESDPEMAAYLEEEEQRKRKAQTLSDYIADRRGKGEAPRFTNIPGQGADTFLMKEAPIQAPLGMDNGMKTRAQYGADPYKLTEERMQEVQAQGGAPDAEKIFMEVRDELSRKDEEAQQQLGLQQAAFLKHGPGTPPKARPFSDILKQREFEKGKKQDRTDSVKFALAEGSGGRVTVMTDEKGGFRLQGAPNEKEIAGLKKKGYAIVPSFNGASFNIVSTGKPGKKATVLTEETLLGIGKQSPLKELEKSVADKIQRESMQAATGAVGGAEGIEDEFGGLNQYGQLPAFLEEEYGYPAGQGYGGLPKWLQQFQGRGVYGVTQ